MMLSFRAVAEAKDLISDLNRVNRVLALDDCDLKEVGHYRDPSVIAGVLPAYRRALEELRAQMRSDLVKLGVDPDGGEEAEG